MGTAGSPEGGPSPSTGPLKAIHPCRGCRGKTGHPGGGGPIQRPRLGEAPTGREAAGRVLPGASEGARRCPPPPGPQSLRVGALEPPLRAGSLTRRPAGGEGAGTRLGATGRRTPQGRTRPPTAAPPAGGFPRPLQVGSCSFCGCFLPQREAAGGDPPCSPPAPARQPLGGWHQAEGRGGQGTLSAGCQGVGRRRRPRGHGVGSPGSSGSGFRRPRLPPAPREFGNKVAPRPLASENRRPTAGGLGRLGPAARPSVCGCPLVAGRGTALPRAGSCGL